MEDKKSMGLCVYCQFLAYLCIRRTDLNQFFINT